MNEYFLEPKSLQGKVKVELGLSHYATKTDLKMQQELTHDLAKKIDLANLKSNVDKLLKGSNRRGVWNSRGGWKIYQNLIVRGGGGVGKIWEVGKN